MWLKLDLDGIEFQLSIKNYSKSARDDLYENWTIVGFSIKSDERINYSWEADETLLSYEVDIIKNSVKKLIDGEPLSNDVITFIEPDFELRQYSYNYNSGEDISMDWITYLWNGGLTSNYISVNFIRDELMDLYNFLRYVTGEISTESDEIKEMYNRGIVYGF